MLATIVMSGLGVGLWGLALDVIKQWNEEGVDQ